MFGFFVMGFVDIVGITTSYVKNDFSHLTDTMVNLISLSCFLWFLVVPGAFYSHRNVNESHRTQENRIT